MTKHINWKTFSILLGLSLVSVLCVMPYVLTLQGELIRKIGQPIWLIFVLQFVQSLVPFSAVIFFGLFFTKKINFKIPLIEGVPEEESGKNLLRSILTTSLISGVVTALLIYATDALFTLAGAALSTHQNYAPAWQKLLAAVYGGATEEILMRLFLMALFIWIGMKMFRRTQPSRVGIVTSIILASIVFGLGHLPLTASLTTITPLIISRAVILNGIGGIVFGWLFWKKGLESAMIAHFTTDIFLLTILPFLLS